MGCSPCAQKRRAAQQAASTPQTVVLTMPDGTESEHESRLEAMAENVRSGGGGTVAAKGR